MNISKIKTEIAERYLKLSKWQIFIILLIVFYAITGWIGSSRQPAIITYCLKPQCAEKKILRIPFEYYSGYPFDTTEKGPHWNELAVEYPSMQPWSSVPLWKRWNAHKLRINLKVLTIADRDPYLLLSYYGTQRPSLQPSLYYGLKQYLTEPEHWNQILFSEDEYPRVFIKCAYRDDPEKMRGLGCQVRSFTPWGLMIDSTHKRVLLPHWKDMYYKTQNLIESFVITP